MQISHSTFLILAIFHIAIYVWLKFLHSRVQIQHFCILPTIAAYCYADEVSFLNSSHTTQFEDTSGYRVYARLANNWPPQIHDKSLETGYLLLNGSSVMFSCKTRMY